MSSYKILLSSLLLTSLLFTSPAFAGGGPISFQIEPNNRTLNPGEQYIVNLEVYADGPFPTFCKGCSVKLALQKPQPSDYIAQSSEKTDENGRMYAKVISKVSGPRTIYASELIDSNGKIVVSNSSAVLKYSGEANVEIPTSELTEVKEVPTIQPPQAIVPTPVGVIIQAPVEDNSKIDELNQKVENLQNQLEVSNQRQSFLETRLNLLISWIKSILPFIN